MKTKTWLPAALALLPLAVAATTVGPSKLRAYPLEVVGITSGCFYLTYFYHFILQQDFLLGGCRPYTLGLWGSLSIFLEIMLLLISVTCAIVIFPLAMDNSLPHFPAFWTTIIGLHLAYYVQLLARSRLKPQAGEAIFVNGKQLQDGETFFVWPWLLEEYELCRKWPVRKEIEA